jgi:hypothetical protein
MDLMLLRTFQRQVELQCKIVLLAALDLQNAINAPGNSAANPQTWASIQNLLTGAANISKALWGQGNKYATEREPLRASIQVDDTSPLKPVVMRNHFEHFDEKLDDWWRDSPGHNFVDQIVGPPNTVVVRPQVDIDIFRRFDPGTGALMFWGKEFNLLEVVAEVERILPITSAEAAKPDYEPPNSGGSGQPQRPS